MLVWIPEERHRGVKKISLLSCLRGPGLLPEVSMDEFSGFQTLVTAENGAQTRFGYVVITSLKEVQTLQVLEITRKKPTSFLSN